MIEINAVTKRYQKQTVLSEINLTMKAGQSIALIGPNGSGKTTLIKLILGLVMPGSGSILVNKIPIANRSDYRRYIGYMPQMSRFPEQMKTRQLFELMRKLRPDVPRRKYDTSLYESLDIARMEHKALGALSGGMKQQLSAALAFYFSPEILILDEPTAALDPISNEILKEKIRSCIHAEKLVITTSHILNDLEEICNHVVYLMDGKVHFDGSMDMLRAETTEERLNKMIISLIKKSEAHHV